MARLEAVPFQSSLGFDFQHQLAVRHFNVITDCSPRLATGESHLRGRLEDELVAKACVWHCKAVPVRVG
jgi:hypothetical protein